MLLRVAIDWENNATSISSVATSIPYIGEKGFMSSNFKKAEDDGLQVAIPLKIMGFD